MWPDSQTISAVNKLLELIDRDIYLVKASNETPACFYIDDKQAGGILVNTPGNPAQWPNGIDDIKVDFIFLPSHFGATDLAYWRQTLAAETLCQQAEAPLVGGVDIELDSKTKLSRTISFLPMAGRSQGSCALHLRNKPGVIFFGAALQTAANGWPTMIPQDDDYDYESRLFGTLGLQDLTFDYAFTDDFTPGKSHFGPGADDAIKQNINEMLAG